MSRAFYQRLTSASAIDGDTLLVTVDRGDMDFSTRTLRLVGGNAPESKGPTPYERAVANAVCRCVQKWVDEVKPEWVESSAKPELYGRWVGRLWQQHPLLPGATDLASWLTAHGLWDSTYTGKRREPWTETALRRIDLATARVLGSST